MRIKKLIIFLLVFVLLISSLSVFAFAQNGDEEIQQASNSNVESKYYGKWKSIPLLVILISFDPNSNGIDDYDASDSTKLFSDKTSPYYGEQWITSSHSAWSNRMFKASNSLSAFYTKMTQNAFTFYPANETCVDESKGGVANDGIVEVVVKLKHPFAQTGNQSNEYSEARIQALKEASKYVNFKSFDTNNNGVINDNELAIMYICAGTEYSSVSNVNGINARLHFSVHAHYTHGNGTNINGVTVGSGGFVRIGEYVTASEIATIGVCAHELGHFLGAPDLYDTEGSANFCGNMSLMASGSWLRYNNVKGMGPAYIDAPLMIYLGFTDYTEIKEDGIYTLSNRNSKNPYNIFKISTPDPNEYYIIENRYVSDDDIYDHIGEKNKGIVIWHVDEKIATSGYSVNSSTKSGDFTHDPGIVPMGKSGLTPSNCGFQKADDGYSDIFTCKNPKYKFPVSESCFTRLNVDEVKDFNFTIKVLSDGANDMKIQVNFYDTMPLYISAVANDITINSVKLDGKVVTYNGKNADKATFILSKNSNPNSSNGIVKECNIDEDGNFYCDITELESNTKYFYKAIVEGKDEKTERINYFYTDFIKKERTDYYVVYMYKGITDVERSFEVKVKPGEVLSYKFPMTKRGYTFCGWYLDAEYKTRYDMSYTQTECKDFNLYGKWVEDDNVSTLVLVGAESKKPIYSCELGDTFEEIVVQERPGYEFVGWYSDEDCIMEFDFTKPTDITGEIKIYAKWALEGGVETVESTNNETTETTTIDETTQISSETHTEENPQENNKNNSTLLIVVLIIVGVAIIAVVCIIIIKKKKVEQ